MANISSNIVEKVFSAVVKPTEEFAILMDKQDPLKRFRYEFEIPPSIPGSKRKESIYMCGNSLGLLPKKTRNYINEELDKWAKEGVEGHFNGKRPWATIDETCCELILPLIGAKNTSEVAIMNGLSVNNQLLMISFYRPTLKRYKILIEGQAFCSDHHTVRSQIKLHNLKVEDALIEVYPKSNENIIHTNDIVEIIEKEGDSIALIWLGALQFYTGQFFDMKTITEKAHKKGCIVGFDLAHAIGNIPLLLHKWNVDIATWCSYKYLNSGPGSIAGIFVHENHHNKQFKQLHGWWGQDLESRFAMKPVHKSIIGAQSWQLSNPPVLPTVCLEASLEIFNEAGINNLRMKSKCLTKYLEVLLLTNLKEHLKIITASDPEQRGCQLSLIFNKPVEYVHKQITSKGVICDIRKPDVMRVAPCPLYNTFQDVWDFVNILKLALLGTKSKL